MRAVLDATWAGVEAALRDRVGSAVFDSWLRPLRPLAMERGVVYIEAPNRLVAERAADFHRDLLEDELSRELGTRVAVSIQARPEAMASPELEVAPSRPIVDTANRTAWLVLQALDEARPLPARLFLFHGVKGSGKSFLLQWWRDRKRRSRRIVFFSGENLVKAFHSAFREHRSAQLCEELAGAHDLLVDEVHRLAGHTRAQLEFAKVLERRAELTEPTLLTSRHHPHDIRDLDPTLATWLLAGFVARVDAPSLEARLAYLRALEGPRSQNGRAESIERLARNVRGGYPELKQAWLVDRHARPELRDHYFELIDPRSTFERLRDQIAERYDVPAEELVGSSQRRRVSQARKVLSWLCVRHGLSRAEVGRYMQRTRAAISYSIRSLEDAAREDAELQRELEGLA